MERALQSVLLVLLAARAAAGERALSAEKGPPFPRIANCYGCRLFPSSTDEDVREVARFDLLIGGLWCRWEDPAAVSRLKRVMRRVREINPHIVVLDFSISAPYAHKTEKDFPQDGWLLTAGGERINGWPGTWMINLGVPEVVDWLVKRVERNAGTRGVDGVFIDCMAPRFDRWACEIERGTPYTVDADLDGEADDGRALDRSWADAKLETARRVRLRIGERAVFMANQAGPRTKAFLNGVLLEDDLDYVLDRGRSWRRVLEHYLDWCNSRRPTVTTIVSSSGIEPPYEMWRLPKGEQERYYEKGRRLVRRMRFGLTTALLGDGYFAYDLHTRARGQRWWYPEYDAPLGYPLGRAVEAPDGTWRREFDGGIVVCNPTMFDCVASFEHSHRDASTGRISRRCLVPAQDGRILLFDGGPERVGSVPEPRPPLTWQGRERVAERDGRILFRLSGGAALFDGKGIALAVTSRARALLRRVGPVIVTDDRWRDWKTENPSHEVRGEKLVFRGERSDGEMRLAYEQTVSLEGGELVIRWHFRALTRARIRAFRLAADLPAGLFLGGEAEAAGRTAALPESPPEAPILRDVVSASFRTADGKHAVRVAFSGKAALQDERRWGVDAYRLVHYPVSGELEPGREWTVSIRIGVE